MFGIGNGLLLPVVTVLIGDTPPQARRGQATALSGTAMFVGQFGSPLVFGPLMQATAITTGYLAAAAIAAAILTITLCATVTDPSSVRANGPIEHQHPIPPSPHTIASDKETLQ